MMGKGLESHKQSINADTRINLKKLPHISYQYPSLDEIHQFMLDFELQAAHQTDEQSCHRGYDPNHYVYYAQKGDGKFLERAFEAASLEGSKRAGALPKAGPMQELTDAPGAGSLPGYFGLSTQVFESRSQFYTSTFNIQQPTPVDHAFFLGPSTTTSHVHHCSIEVHDYDTQQPGHQLLVKKRYRPASGVGHYVLRSQIFNYWWEFLGQYDRTLRRWRLSKCRDVIGYMIPAGPALLAIWGPELPAAFFE
ncbi:uncharacterized protein BO88DRAFT_423688 [Aspergillus vadensis CBS 113365]|uniref:Uncharacterized protein n=1 Tax=Aspergillus vadensis (strain CBS 113365 / IMI 142717 / IBT 24658) TaxID=1448311 RepID=A0A319C977_ASPVC|nr:hypothetical protein BO88DRAFT_423688 [Aspergillus vadensis CBS 113365]PYH71898.1 hypothetical protein BO88DRAFT_423688 [Aspergillus vadensis CBS 113365]